MTALTSFMNLLTCIANDSKCTTYYWAWQLLLQLILLITNVVVLYRTSHLFCISAEKIKLFQWVDKNELVVGRTYRYMLVALDDSLHSMHHFLKCTARKDADHTPLLRLTITQNVFEQWATAAWMTRDERTLNIEKCGFLTKLQTNAILFLFSRST